MRNQHSTPTAHSPRAAKMGGLTLPSRRDPVVRTTAAAWRSLTSSDRACRNGPGEPTILACSGGGDSSALVLALTAAAGRKAPDLLTVAHVVHDLRPANQRLADRDRTAELARSLGLPFVEASIAVKELPGNAESNARKLRYDALRQIAAARGVRFIATAHNIHDQAESVLMALLRGCGPRGLAGVASIRRLSPNLTLVRPMLAVAPADARRLCADAGWSFAHDQTNDDPTRLRNAIRADILPRLLALRPGAEHRIASAAERCRDADEAVRRSACVLLASGRAGHAFCWPRDRLRRIPRAVLGETLRRAAAKMAPQGAAALDTLSARTLQSATRLIRSADTERKTLCWSGVTVKIDAHSVRVTAR